MTEHDDVSMAGPRLAVRVAELIRLAAKSSSRSQQEIAERMGIGESRVSQIVNGDGNYHVATIARFFAAADCTVDVRVFDSNQSEVAIRPRRKPRRATGGTTYVHPVETADGKVIRVESYSPHSLPGTPLDFPMAVDRSIEYERLSKNAFVYELDTAGL